MKNENGKHLPKASKGISMLIGSLFLVMALYGAAGAIVDKQPERVMPALISLIIGVCTLWFGRRSNAGESQKQLEKKKNDSEAADNDANETEYESFPASVSQNEFERIMKEEGLSYTYIELGFGPEEPGTRIDIYVNENVLSVRNTNMRVGRSNIKKHVYRTEQEALGAALERMRYYKGDVDDISEEYKKIYSLVEEGCLKEDRNIPLNIGKEVRSPGMFSCVKKYDGWYFYEYDDHAYLCDSIGPIKDFDMFMLILCVKLGLRTEEYKITRENIQEVSEAMKEERKKKIRI